MNFDVGGVRRANCLGLYGADKEDPKVYELARHIVAAARSSAANRITANRETGIGSWSDDDFETRR
jgi:hypothetical protein